MTAAVQAESGWPALFNEAFRRSRNPMTLVDEQRRHVAVNGAYLALLGHWRADVVGRRIVDFVVRGPRLSDPEWRAAIADPRSSGEAELSRADGTTVTVQWAATVEVATGRRLVLFVVLSASRWGARMRRDPANGGDRPLTPRERDVVWLVALGHSGPEIAGELHIAHDTVRTHVRNAMEKTGARSRAHLVAKAMGDGLFLRAQDEPLRAIRERTMRTWTGA